MADHTMKGSHGSPSFAFVVVCCGRLDFVVRMACLSRGGMWTTQHICWWTQVPFGSEGLMIGM